MPLFLLKFKIIESMREDCMILFGGMTTDDDKKDAGPEIQILGRWSTLGQGAGFCICKAPSNDVLGKWLYNWVHMATITVTPVVDDNQARTIILEQPPEYQVEYDTIGHEPPSDKSLFFIEYKFLDGCKTKGFNTFANLSKDADLKDAGNNVSIGRWHDLATGTGVAICASNSEMDLQKWAYNWREVCECHITPVLTDKQFRNIVKNTADFDKKKSVLLEKMNPTAKRRWF